MITIKKIYYLFDELWPAMEHCQEHKQTCLRLFAQIEKQFIRHKLDFDELLESLVQYEGIGLTIATGLIWASYPSRAIPFDKFTLTWCLQKKYIRSETISEDYKTICKNVIKQIKTRRKPISIEEFVRESRIKIEDTLLAKAAVGPK